MLPRKLGKLAEDVEVALEDEETTPLVGRSTTSGAGATSDLAALQEHFGIKLLIMLSVTQHAVNGFARSFTGPAQMFLYQAYKVPGPQMQVYGGVTKLPLAMKPIVGLMSDHLPIIGFHKMPYIFLTAVVGMWACANVGLVAQEDLSITHLVICFFAMSFMFSTVALLTEAKYAERLRPAPQHGPALMTFVWGGSVVGGLMGAVFIGPVLERYGPKLPFLIALVPICAMMVPLVGNYLGERVKNAEELADARRNMENQFDVSVLCFMIFVLSVFLSILGLTVKSVAANALASLVGGVVMLFSFSVVLRPIIAKVNAFFLLLSCLHVNIGGAAFYFMTDTPEAFPEGPHFSKEFFAGVLGIVGWSCSLLGIWSYKKYATTWSYQRIFITINVVLGVVATLDVIFFARLNVTLGIPDHAFVLGVNALEEVISAWLWMPAILLLSNLCPEGMEAIMFGLLAGCYHLGGTIAANCGAYLLISLGCEPSGAPGESAQFENLWIAALIRAVLPLLTVILVPLMIPDAQQTDKLLPDGDRDATKSSPLRRWRGIDDD